MTSKIDDAILAIECPGGEIHYAESIEKIANKEKNKSNLEFTENSSQVNYLENRANLLILSSHSVIVRTICSIDFGIHLILIFIYDDFLINFIICLISLNGYYSAQNLDKTNFCFYLFYQYLNTIYKIFYSTSYLFLYNYQVNFNENLLLNYYNLTSNYYINKSNIIYNNFYKNDYILNYNNNIGFNVSYFFILLIIDFLQIYVTSYLHYFFKMLPNTPYSVNQRSSFIV